MPAQMTPAQALKSGVVFCLFLLSSGAFAFDTVNSAPLNAPQSPPAQKGPTLYKRLGGGPGIVAVVEEFASRCASDKRINRFFSGLVASPPRMKRFKGLLVNQICAASGGPCKYTGRKMKDAHAGMGVSEADFNTLVEDLVGALDKYQVGAKEKGEILAVLGPVKADIVEKKQ
jgi:hemoglobin